VIAQERLPALRGGPAGPDHIDSLDANLDHLQLAMDPWRAPGRILFTHQPDQVTQLAIDLGPAAAPAKTSSAKYVRKTLVDASGAKSQA